MILTPNKSRRHKTLFNEGHAIAYGLTVCEQVDAQTAQSVVSVSHQFCLHFSHDVKTLSGGFLATAMFPGTSIVESDFSEVK